MSWINFMLGREGQVETEERAVPQSAEDFFYEMTGNPNATIFGLGGPASSGERVTPTTVMRVPAFAAAVSVISSTIAGLPFHVYRRQGTNRAIANSRLNTLLADAPNPSISSFEFRKALLSSKLRHGRGLAWIERNSNTKQVEGLWLLDPQHVTVERRDFKNFYVYKPPKGRSVTYTQDEIIDLPFLLESDGYTSLSPVEIGKDVFGKALAASRYGAKFLNNGGVPPFAIVGNFQTTNAMKRAAEDFDKAVEKSAKEKRQALTLPAGLDIKQIGANPEQSQMLESEKFAVEECARIFNIPPTFLQDLSNGTYSNTEQADLHFAKHTLKPHVEQLEQEFNLKLFGPSVRTRFVDLNMDGILRGDFKSRMEGYSQAISSSVMTPAEAREKENLPLIAGSDKLMTQGANVPLDQAGLQNENGNSGEPESP